MRILHSSDWHLGRFFHQYSLIEDQAYTLDRFIELARALKPDLICLPGDLYDKAVPPSEAVELLSNVIAELTLNLGIPVVASCGNHEHGIRLSFGARLFAKARFHVVGTITDPPALLPFEDAHGPVYVGVIPYAVPSICRERLKDESLQNHDLAMAALTGRLRAAIPAGARSIVMAHAYVEGGKESESERELTIGGASAVHPSRFDGFHYVALGHLHRPQYVARETLRYCGSALKYSFSEADHVKSVTLIDMDAKGGCRIETHPLPARRDVRVVRGKLADLLRDAAADKARGDFLRATLTDEGALVDPMGQLREVYPHVLEIEREVPFVAPGQLAGLGADHRKHTVTDVLKSFYRDMRGAELTAGELGILNDVVEVLRRDEGGGLAP